MSEEIDCDYTDEVVCPYCGYKDSNSEEYFPRSSDSTNVQCNCSEAQRSNAYNHLYRRR